MHKRTDFVIRKMTCQDIPALLEVETDVFTTTWSEQAFLDEYNNPLTTYLLICEQQQVIGYAGFWLVVHEAQITNVAVKQNWQGLGLGRELMQALIKEARKQKAQSISLEVRASNLVAQNLYTSLGFQEVGIRPGYYLDNQENALLMQLII